MVNRMSGKRVLEQRIRFLIRAIRKQRNKNTRTIYKQHLEFLKSEYNKVV